MDINVTNNLNGMNNSLKEIVRQLDSINKLCFDISNAFKDFKDINLNNTNNQLLELLDIFSNLTGIIADLDIIKKSISLLPTPIKELGVALAALGGAFALLEAMESEYEKQIRLTGEAQQKLRDEMQKTTEVIYDGISSSIDRAKTTEAEMSILNDYVNKLEELGKDGYVQNLKEAEIYVNKINEIMPNAVKLTEDGKLKWLENADAIRENINQLEKKAKVEAYKQNYLEKNIIISVLLE